MTPSPHTIARPPAEAEAPPLPRLAYIGDVPVESSHHGSALLHRLLENYPAARLRIVETNLHRSSAGRRLPGVEYAAVPVGVPRLLRTRFTAWYSSWLTLAAGWRTGRLRAVLEGFEPEAVLTVPHGYAWLAAAAYARARQIPLHLIIHDDWPRVAKLPAPFRSWLDRAFGAVYRQAVTRFCVSPFMAEDYRERYGAEGEVLYPSRAAQAEVFAAPPETGARPPGGLRVAFAGTLTTPDYWHSLQDLARSLRNLNGELLIFAPMSPDQAKGAGLTAANIALRGNVEAALLIQRLRTEADVLVVPMSFAETDRANMQMGFPSKLTDCTAAALPLLILGPEYCSAVRWARENPGVAEVVTDREANALDEALRRLSAEEHRRSLGTAAAAVGRRYFSHERAEDLVFRRLAAGRN